MDCCGNHAHVKLFQKCNPTVVLLCRYSQELLDDVAKARRQAARTQTAAVTTPPSAANTAQSTPSKLAGSSSGTGAVGASSSLQNTAGGASSTSQATTGASGSHQAPGAELEGAPTVTCAACGARGVTTSADATTNLPWLKRRVRWGCIGHGQAVNRALGLCMLARWGSSGLFPSISSAE